MQAVTFTITPATLGVLAVMIVIGAVAGLVMYFITGFVTFTGIDSGDKFHEIWRFFTFRSQLQHSLAVHTWVTNS
jgi:uncharacterized membrane-anchored protein